MADDADVTVSAKKERDTGSGNTSGGRAPYVRRSAGGAPRSSGGGRGGGSSTAPSEPYIPFVSGSILPAPPTEDDLATITVESTVPLPSGDVLQLGNPRGLLSFGNALTPNFRPGNLPGLDRPPSLGAPPAAFVGPEPETLPEVKVEGKKPTGTGNPPRTLTPGAFAAFTRGALTWGFWLLTKPRDLNLGEQRRIDEQRKRELSQLILPVVPSVARLPEPLAEVTVRADRLAGTAPNRSTRGVRSEPSPELRRIRVGFQPTPNSFLYPTPQKTGTKFPITSDVTFGTSTRPLVGTTPRPRPQPRTRAPSVPIVPSIPGVPGVGPIPGVPGVGLITPVVPQPFTPGTLTQFQPGRVNDCRCVKAKKKPDRKPRTPRTICYRGTYTEFSNGTVKKQLEQVPCETKAAARARQPKKPRAPRKPKLKPGQFPGMGVF